MGEQELEHSRSREQPSEATASSSASERPELSTLGTENSTDKANLPVTEATSSGGAHQGERPDLDPSPAEARDASIATLKPSAESAQEPAAAAGGSPEPAAAAEAFTAYEDTAARLTDAQPSAVSGGMSGPEATFSPGGTEAQALQS